MKRLIRGTLILASVGGAATFTASPAKAACHAFTFAQATYSVDEAGGQVTIGVRRDLALNPSSVRIRTADVDAEADQDCKPLVNHLVEWTVADSQGTPEAIQKNVRIDIVNDTADEPNENFRVEFVPGSGGGCQINDDFTYGDPTIVTIQDNDESAPASPGTTPAKTAPAGQTSRSTTRSPSPSPSPTPTASPSPLPSPEENPVEVTSATQPEQDDDGFPVGLVAAIALVLLGGTGAGIWYLRRRAPG